MGRKKKIEEQPEIKEEEKEIEVKPNNSVQYSGSVSVKLKKGNKVLQTKSFKNNGRWPLFQCLSSALRGQFTEADNFRPRAISLFSIPKNLTIGGKIPVISQESTSEVLNKIGTYANKDNCVSSSITLFNGEIKPEVANTDTGLGWASVTYSFLVPFTNLTLSPDSGWPGAEGYTLQPVNMVCLYSRANNPGEDLRNYSNPSAYFFVADSEDTTKLGNLLPNLSSLDTSYSLEITWTLTLKNPS